MIETYSFGEKMGHARPAIDAAMQKMAQERPDFRLISPDVGRAGMPEFIKKFPKQYYNTGIAEMAAMDLAAGLALEGFLPYVYGMSVFNTLRAAEGIRTNICYQGANVKLIGNNTGLSQGPCGSTHYAMEDLAILRTFPRMTLCVPGDPSQAVKAFEAAADYDGPVYIRLANGRNEPEVYKSDYKFEFIYSILYKPCVFKAYRLLNIQTLCIFPCFCPYEPKQGKFFMLRRLPYPVVLRKYASLPL